LGGISRKDHRSVRVSAITKLTTTIKRIHVAPVATQQRAVRNHSRIEADLHRFLMTCVFTAHLAIGGLIHMAAAITTDRVNHPWEVFQIVL
jgi:hypothetical protein